MGLEPTSRTIVEPSKTCKSGTNVEPRLHKYSTLVWRENFGDSDTGASYECDGLDECLIGEDEENPSIVDQPVCSCQNKSLRTGKKRMRDLSGRVKAYYEPSPRSWCEESVTQSSAGNGPPRNAGEDVILVDGLNLKVKSGCYPLQVKPYVEICGWDIYPDDLKAVSRFIEWTIFQTEKDKDREQLVKKRCKPLGDKRLGCFDIPAESELEINLDAGLQYAREVLEGFDSNLDEIKIVADVTEITSFDALETGVC